MTLLATRSDAEVVAAVLAGDASAFAILLGRYRDSYTRFAVRMLGDREDADDALQSAFVRAYRNLATCEDPSRFGAWLHRIAINECRTLATRRARRGLRMVRDEVALDRAVQVDTTFDGTALREEIQRALDLLDTDQSSRSCRRRQRLAGRTSRPRPVATSPRPGGREASVVAQRAARQPVCR